MTLRSKVRTLRLVVRLLVLTAFGRLKSLVSPVAAGRAGKTQATGLAGTYGLAVAAGLALAVGFACTAGLFVTGCLAPAPDTPLARAAEAGETLEVVRLLAAGADPEQRTGFGLTPLILAVRAGRADAAEALIAGGADVNRFDAPPTREPWSPLMNAAHKRQPELVRLLLDAKADPALANENGDTPLMMAAGEGEIEIVKMLLDAGAPAGHASNSGATALENAVACGSTEVVRELLAREPGLALPDSLRSGVARTLARMRGRGEILDLVDTAAARP